MSLSPTDVMRSGKREESRLACGSLESQITCGCEPEISTAATSIPSWLLGVPATYRVVPSTRVTTSWCSPRTAETLSRVHAVPMPAAQALERLPVFVADPAYP